MLPPGLRTWHPTIPAFVWFAGGLLSATFPTIAARPSSCSVHNNDIEEMVAHAQGTSLLQAGKEEEPSPHRPKTALANGGAYATPEKLTKKQLPTSPPPAPAPAPAKHNPEKKLAWIATDTPTTNYPTNPPPEKHDPKKIAMDVSDEYVSALKEIGNGNLKPYLDMLCDEFVVTDPVGTSPQSKKKHIKAMLRDKQDFITPEGFALSVDMVSIAQNKSYAAVFSTMSIKGSNGKPIETRRSDLLTIDPTGCISSAESYWSLAGSWLSTSRSVQAETTEWTIRKYLKALHELGTNQSLAYFSQFAPSGFEVHDPLGTPSKHSITELQGNIVELSKAVAPYGFAVSVKGVAVSADDHFGSAHLVLHLFNSKAEIFHSVDIIDIFEITEDGFIKSLKAVWHIS